MTRSALCVPMLLLALLLAQACFGQDHGQKARDITGQPEYSGYRVRSQTGPGSGQGSGGGGGSGSGGGGQSGNGQGGNPGEGNPDEFNPREGNPDDWQPVEEGDRDDWKAPESEAGEWKPDRPDDAWGTPRGEGFKRDSTATGPQRPPGRSSGSRGGGGGGGGGSPAFAAFLGTVFQVVMWVVLIGAALVALFFIVKALLGIRFNKRSRKAKASKKKADAAKSATDTPAADGPDMPELPQEFEDALVVARRELADALAKQDYARATVLRYRVFWLEAGWRGCVEQADVRTWRDALRMARKEARGQLRPSLTLVERVRYGDYQPGASEYDQWQSQLQLVEPRGVIA